MEIEESELKKIYDLLQEIKYPKVEFVKDYNSMKDSAITIMRDCACEAQEILEKNGIE